MRWLREEFRGLRMTERAHVVAECALLVSMLGGVYVVITALVPWCAA